MIMKPRIYAAKHTQREITELLESDDELPDTYDETPKVPAYLNDNRFTKVAPIEEGLYQSEQINLPPKLVQQESFTSKETIDEIATFQSCSQENLKAFVPEQTARTLDDKKILISKGVLTKRDIFLIKSIEEYATDATLLWFIDFLNYKAVKSHQRSCLVLELMDRHFTEAMETSLDFEIRNLKLVIH